MAERRLTPEEEALWRRVMATVRQSRSTLRKAEIAAPTAVAPVAEPPRQPKAAPASPKRSPSKQPPITPTAPKPGTTLDGGWDRRLASGTATPDSSIDLHGHTLHSAYNVLDIGLARAIARGDRVLLLVTGKPPRPESERPHARGRIRDSVDSWLAASRHAADIAAVRPAHPRHGGAGALYIVLRRPLRERKY